MACGRVEIMAICSITSSGVEPPTSVMNGGEGERERERVPWVAERGRERGRGERGRGGERGGGGEREMIIVSCT